MESTPGRPSPFPQRARARTHGNAEINDDHAGCDRRGGAPDQRTPARRPQKQTREMTPVLFPVLLTLFHHIDPASQYRPGDYRFLDQAAAGRSAIQLAESAYITEELPRAALHLVR